MRLKVLLLILVLLASPAWPRVQAQTMATAQSLPTMALHIGSATLNTEVASTTEQREKGLMFRTSLADNDAMIFLMPRVMRAHFWMKNTLIPLSVAFIDKNGVILEIHDMQPAAPSLPDSAIPVTNSESDQVAYALETNLHWFSLNNIKPGTKIEPSLPPAISPSPTE